MKKFKLASLATALVLSLSAFAGCGGGGNKVDNDKAWNSLNSGEIIQLVFAGRDVDTEKANYQAFVDEFNKTHENIVIELKWWRRHRLQRGARRNGQKPARRIYA